MKTCQKCKTPKSLSNFFKSSRSRDGHQPTCKSCQLAYKNQMNKQKRAAGILTNSQLQRRRLRLEVLTYYSQGMPRCDCCGESHIEFLAIDHMHGGGHQQRKQIGESGLYTWLKRNDFPSGFRVLCHNCNQAIGAYGFCPHKQLPPTHDLELPKEKLHKRILAAISSLQSAAKPITISAVAAEAGVSYITVWYRYKALIADGYWPRS